MFNAELDMCKQLYNEHVKQVSEERNGAIHSIIFVGQACLLRFYIMMSALFNWVSYGNEELVLGPLLVYLSSHLIHVYNNGR